MNLNSIKINNKLAVYIRFLIPISFLFRRYSVILGYKLQCFLNVSFEGI